MEQTFSQWYIGAPNGVVLCVNERHGCELSGVFYHSYKTEPTGFMDLGQMTLLMEKFFDELQFPHPGTNERNFFPQNKPYLYHSRPTQAEQQLAGTDNLDGGGQDHPVSLRMGNGQADRKRHGHGEHI